MKSIERLQVGEEASSCCRGGGGDGFITCIEGCGRWEVGGVVGAVGLITNTEECRMADAVDVVG